MAELVAIIGLTASILNIVEGVSKGLGILKALRKAPDEIASLQHELASFKKAVQDIAAFQGDRGLLDSTVESELSRSKEVVQKLQIFIDSSLLRKGRPSRRRWAKKLGRIMQLREDLRVGRNQLVLGLVVSNSAYSSKTAAQLDTITHQLSLGHSSAQMIEKSLQQICSQSNSTQELIRRSTELASETKELVLSTASNTRNSWKPEQGQFSAVRMTGSHGSKSLTISRKENKETYLRERPSILDENLYHSASAGPGSPFEQSPSYCPAQYTLSTRVSQVRVLAIFQKSCSSVQRVNEYHIIFSPPFRRWFSIILSVSIQRSSKYWSPFRVTTSRSTTTNYMPKPLERKLGTILSETDNPGDHLELAMELSDDKHPEKGTRNITYILDTPRRQLLDFARDLGCPTYSEREITPLYDYGNPRGSTGIAALVSGLAHGQLCCEERLLATGLNMEETKWKLALYQCLMNSPHVPNLLGVVTDSSSRYVKSILTDTTDQLSPMPLHKIIKNVQDNGQAITLTRRLSWARQIITGICDLHQRGFIVGQMELSVLGVNSRNEIQIICYRKKGRLSDLRYPFIAPELRGSSQDADILFTSRTDLFQLGLVLWQIGQHKHIREAQSELCPIAGCTCLNTTYENDQHSGAIALPPMNKDIPNWYKKAVEVCRSENPGDKWTASELLSLFPPPESLSVPTSDTFSLNESWDMMTFCDSCHIRIFIAYTCKACMHGDFDLCSVCFNAGEHCTAEDHFLEEMIYRKEFLAWKPTGRHYSKSNQDSGQRSMLYLE